MDHGPTGEHPDGPPVPGQRGPAHDVQVIIANLVHVAVDRQPQAPLGAHAGPALILLAPFRRRVSEAGFGLPPVGVAFLRHLALPPDQPHLGEGRLGDDRAVRWHVSRRDRRCVCYRRHARLNRPRFGRRARSPAGHEQQKRHKDNHHPRNPRLHRSHPPVSVESAVVPSTTIAPVTARSTAVSCDEAVSALASDSNSTPAATAS